MESSKLDVNTEISKWSEEDWNKVEKELRKRGLIRKSISAPRKLKEYVLGWNQRDWFRAGLLGFLVAFFIFPLFHYTAIAISWIFLDLVIVVLGMSLVEDTNDVATIDDYNWYSGYYDDIERSENEPQITEEFA